MVGVKIWGGLGNQMFQYAFALYLAEKRKCDFSFFSEVNNKSLDDFALINFKVDLSKFPESYRKKLGYSFSNDKIYRFKRKIIQLLPFMNKRVLVEKGLHFKEHINKEYILFDGYWQSFKYLDSINVKLRNKFIFKDPNLYKLDLYNEILLTNSVSLHIRKGDYLHGKNALIYEDCPISYYLKSIELISQNVEEPIFYVFSNDLNWAMQNLKVSADTSIKFVDNSNYADPAIADMFLMSSCKNNIIANSTFSWWSAWLNSNINKIIIAPKKWYVGDLNHVTKELIPVDWHRI